MNLFRGLIIFLSTVYFFISPSVAFSKQTNACHCFKNRVYNPADRFAADEYFLATSFNSLIAKMYSIPKKQIVFLKMKGGASHIDLIIALRVFQITGYELQQLLNLRKNKKTWKEILFLPAISAKSHKDRFLNELLKGKESKVVGLQIANILLADFYGVSIESVQQLRELGVGEKEMAFVFILAQTKGVQPLVLVKQYQAGKSWGQVAHDINITPSQVGTLIMDYESKNLKN